MIAPSLQQELQEVPTSVSTNTFPASSHPIASTSSDHLLHIATMIEGPYKHFEWAPDGDSFAISISPGGPINLIDANTLETIWSADLCANGIAFNRLGKQISIGSCDEDAILILDSADGRTMSKLYDESGLCHHPWYVEYGKDEETLISGTGFPGLGKDLAYSCTWNLGDGSSEIIIHEQGELDTFVVSDDGNLIAIGLVDPPGDKFRLAKILRISDNEMICLLEGSDISLGPSGEFAVIHEYEKEIISLWDIETCQRIMYFEGDFPRPSTSYSMAFSPNGELFAVGHTSIYLFNTRTGGLLESVNVCELEEHCNIRNLEFNPRGDILVSVDAQRIDFWTVGDEE